MCLCRVLRQYNSMAHLSTDILDLYQTYFAKPYYVEPRPEQFNVTSFGMPVSEKMLGREVFLPVTLLNGKDRLDIACCTLRVTGQRTVIRTAVSERIGTVKELFQVGDWKFDVKGVLIAQAGDAMPDRDMYALRQMFESTKPLVLENAVSDLFLDSTQYVCMTDLEFPEVEGRSLRHRPFTFSCESDYINSLMED